MKSSVFVLQILQVFQVYLILTEASSDDIIQPHLHSASTIRVNLIDRKKQRVLTSSSNVRGHKNSIITQATTYTDIPLQSSKRGISSVCKCQNVLNGSYSWYYNWNTYTRPIVYQEAALNSSGIPFVPMVWGNVTRPPPAILPEGILLSFNEPDIATQANMTPAVALQLWDTLILSVGATRISSPAVSQWNYFKWMNAFLAGNSTYKPTVDFMSVHWYGSNVTAFLAFVDLVYTTYNKPLWVTEFSFADFKATATNPTNFTTKDVLDFMQVAVLGLENRPYVERYAYYSDEGGSATMGFAALFNASVGTVPYKTLTLAGQVFSGVTVPTCEPTAAPSVWPSVQPSIFPSQTPSSPPSVSPTVAPTGKPSTQPSVAPTSMPSVLPSSQPSSVPTTQPSVAPTTQPSITPTTLPSVFPSSKPSLEPTCQPSITPTTLPSVFPSSKPSLEPTSQPSIMPTTLPSVSPSSKPSVEPTSQPSITPTTLPSVFPSSKPSVEPTCQPSIMPTTLPSVFPSSKPSLEPTSQPSIMPTTQPSVLPSSQPSSVPTTQPSVSPSSKPSVESTCQPSIMPTTQPSVLPSTQPSITPTTQPSNIPSKQPSNPPSVQPSTLQPSSQPTTTPSSPYPSLRPSFYPTFLPSSTPSSPTLKPTLYPTAPSFSPTLLSTIPIKSSKRGISSVCNCQNVHNTSFAWYFNWNTYSRLTVLQEVALNSSGIPFVPMVWGNVIRPPPPVLREGVLLTFNQPDIATQANMTPAVALQLWDTLILSVGATRIGSPAVSQWNYFKWMNAFLAGNSTYKPTVDFMAINWYGTNATTFLAYVDSIWSTYKKPIWVTDFAFTDFQATQTKPTNFTSTNVLNFVKTAVLGLENRPYVERYAYYSDEGGSATMGFAALFNASVGTVPYKTLTLAGQAYTGYA